MSKKVLWLAFDIPSYESTVSEKSAKAFGDFTKAEAKLTALEEQKAKERTTEPLDDIMFNAGGRVGFNQGGMGGIDMIILGILIAHWYLSLFFQTFFLNRYASHKLYNMSMTWEKIFYIFTFIF